MSCVDNLRRDLERLEVVEELAEDLRKMDFFVAVDFVDGKPMMYIEKAQKLGFWSKLRLRRKK